MLQSQVAVADVIIQGTYVIANGRRIYGGDEEVTIAMQKRGSSLQIWVATAEMQSGPIPYHDVSGALADALAIPSSNNSLVMPILVGTDAVKIEKRLEQAGYGRRVTLDGSTASTAAGPAARVFNVTSRSQTSAARPQLNNASGRGSLLRSSRMPPVWNPDTNGHQNYRQLLMNGTSQGASNGFASLRAPRGRRDGHMRTRIAACAQNESSSAYQSTGNGVDTSRLNLVSMRSTLERAFADDASPAAFFQSTHTATDGETLATKSELAIGGAGEKFVSLFHTTGQRFVADLSRYLRY